MMKKQFTHHNRMIKLVVDPKGYVDKVFRQTPAGNFFEEVVSPKISVYVDDQLIDAMKTSAYGLAVGIEEDVLVQQAKFYIERQTPTVYPKPLEELLAERGYVSDKEPTGAGRGPGSLP